MSEIPDFEPFGLSHIFAIFITIFFVLGHQYITCRSGRVIGRFFTINYTVILTGLLVVTHLTFVAYCLLTARAGLEYLLPLHTCELAMFLLIAHCLLQKKPQIQKYITAILYYWLMLGGIVSLLMPDSFGFGFPHFIFVQTFIYHGLQLLICLHITVAQKFELPKFSPLIAFGAVLIASPFAVIADILIPDANYMFLAQNVQGVFAFINIFPLGASRLALMAIIVLGVFCLLKLVYKPLIWANNAFLTTTARIFERTNNT